MGRIMWRVQTFLIGRVQLMLKLNIDMFELISIHKKIETHPDTLHMKTWNAEESTVSLFLIHRVIKIQDTQARFFIAGILEYSRQINIQSDNIDYMQTIESDEPVGQLTLFSPVVQSKRDPDSAVQGQEYMLLVELGIFPKSLELVSKCIWCKNTNTYTQEDIEEDGQVKCKNCGHLIYPVKDILYEYHKWPLK
jgi:DNA-directed RNA polymerase subunit RPC12/RpoP